jgi:hypothetical protein
VYADKIRPNDDGDLALVAKDSTRARIVDPGDPVTRPVQEAARRCHLAPGCRDYSLFDFRIDPGGQPWFLEAGLCFPRPQERDLGDGGGRGDTGSRALPARDPGKHRPHEPLR